MTQSEDDVGVPSGASGWGALSQSLYHDLRQRARELMVGERIDHTLQPTALVHEALGRLLSGRVTPRDRCHLFALAARAMRRVLIDEARRRRSGKHGGDVEHTWLQLAEIAAPRASVDVIELDDALCALHAIAPRSAEVAELLLFGGMGAEEIAVELQVHANTVRNDWRAARAWLLERLGDGDGDGLQ